MSTVVRVARVLIILVLAMLTVSLVIALGSSSTGWLEKAVLLLLIGGVVYAAMKVGVISARMTHRLRH